MKISVRCKERWPHWDSNRKHTAPRGGQKLSHSGNLQMTHLNSKCYSLKVHNRIFRVSRVRSPAGSVLVTRKEDKSKCFGDCCRTVNSIYYCRKIIALQ